MARRDLKGEIKVIKTELQEDKADLQEVKETSYRRGGCQGFAE
jgi:hypothetical protein